MMEKIFKTFQRIGLRKEEKDAQKQLLLSYMKEHPVRNITEDRHNYQRSFLGLLNKPIIHLQPMSVIAALIIMMTAGAGVSVAAEGAVPGDALYPVKVSLNEEVREVLSFSAEARADWAVEKAERRLEEIEQLSAEGRLDAALALEAQTRLQAHIEEVNDRAERFGEKEEEHLAAKVHSDLEGRLAAHKNVLMKLKLKTPASQEEVDEILEKVEVRLTEATERRMQAEADVSAKTKERVEAAAQGKMRAAKNKIEEVGKFIERRGERVRPEVKAKALAKLQEAEELFAQGEAHMDAGVYGEAFASFQKSMRVAQAAKLTLSAGFKLDIILNGDADENDSSGEDSDQDEESNESDQNEDDVDESESDENDESNENDGRNDDSDTSASTTIDVEIDAEVRI